MTVHPDRYRIQRGANVPSRVAAVLISAGGLGDFARRVRGQDPEVDAVLAALTAEALDWTRMARARHGRDTTTPPPPGSARQQGLSTGQAAAVIGCSTRTVQRRIDQGLLPAELVGGRYVIAPETAEHHRAARAHDSRSHACP